uniref:MORN repeat-containing protein 5 n=1 Tax=Glossina palpalis gambiensis TaxID=67801 RepID=A0A1B0BJ15_9MUSC
MQPRLLERLTPSITQMAKVPPEKKRKPNYHYFLTGSNFTGSWLPALHIMEGYGVYTFPDGSEYRGYFAKGVFHGYGLLHLTKPYGITFKGLFIEGHLSEMVDIWFDDNVHVEASFQGWKADFSKWRYCSQADRRYLVERVEGLAAVGLKSFKRIGQPPFIPKKLYDVGEGLYNPVTRMIIKRPNPFPSWHYVACEGDHYKITEGCRSGTPLTVKDIPLQTRRQIVQLNVKSAEELEEAVPSCNYDPIKERKKFLKGIRRAFEKNPENLQARLMTDLDKSESSVCVGTAWGVSTSSCSSFSCKSLNVDREEQLETTREYDKHVWGRLPSDQSFFRAS